ncbi:MAG: hypothetical protein R3B72_05750 [Polyangiaceae bacterium]
MAELGGRLLRILPLLAVLPACQPEVPTHSPATPRASVTPPAPAPTASSVAPPPAPAPSSTEEALPPIALEGDRGPELPPGFVAIPDPRLDGQTASATCQGLTITNVLEGSAEPFVRVTDDAGTKRYEAHGRRYGVDPTDQSLVMSLVADYCGDLTGDGVPEIVLTERTLGAHCCYTHYVVSLTRPTQRLLSWEKGDAGTGLWPVKAEAGAAFQLASTVVTSPPFDADAGDPVISYASAPLLPILFRLEGSEYRARTFRLATYLRDQRAIDDARCAEQSGCERSLLIDWGIALIIGDWPQRRQIWRDTDDAAYLPALDRRAAAFQRDLKRQLEF